VGENHSSGHPAIRIVVANALRRTLPDYLLDSPGNDSLAKFIADRQDTGSMRLSRLAAWSLERTRRHVGRSGTWLDVSTFGSCLLVAIICRSFVSG
jgi:hypothetical protein